MSKKDEYVTYRGKTFEKITADNAWVCPKCCFYDKKNAACASPSVKFDGCKWGNFYWVKIEGGR